MKTLVAAMLATGLAFAPAAFAEDAVKLAMKDSKMKKSDGIMDKKDPMITKDEMTR